MTCDFDTRMWDCGHSQYLENLDPLGNNLTGAFWRLNEDGQILTLSTGEQVMDFNHRINSGSTGMLAIQSPDIT